MRLILKILAAPLVAVLTPFVWICTILLETGDLQQVPLRLPQTVYFVQRRYSESRESLFYHGGGDQEGVTFYGALDMETGEGTLFEAKNFEAISIEVTGDYAVVNVAVPPGAVSGSGRVLLIDVAGKAGTEITLKSQSENDLAVVTKDGKTLVTCSATDSKEDHMKLELDAISKSYGKFKALRNVSATLEDGVYGLLGPNGAGKTTLINILIGILPSSGGTIRLDGNDTAKMGAATLI